jgi:hypothetical protein
MFFPRDHQAGKIEGILMRWRIGTMVVAEFTVIALIDDPMVVGERKLGDVTLILVDTVEQRIERRTQIETAPAAIADFIDALRVFLKLRRIDGVDQAQAIHGWGEHALSHQQPWSPFSGSSGLFCFSGLNRTNQIEQTNETDQRHDELIADG